MKTTVFHFYIASLICSQNWVFHFMRIVKQCFCFLLAYLGNELPVCLSAVLSPFYVNTVIRRTAASFLRLLCYVLKGGSTSWFCR